MANSEHYSMIIEWSDEDDAYIVTLPEFPGCHTHGSTREEALQHGQEVLQLIIESREDSGRSLPQPRLYHLSDADVAGEPEVNQQQL